MPDETLSPEQKLSDRLEGWLKGDQPKTVGNLIELFGEKSFAVLFLLLLAIPALPLPTGGVTHVFELIAMLLALELIVGRRTVWLPERWRGRELGPATQKRFSEVLLRRIRWLERHSRPRLRFLIDHPLRGQVFGLLVLGLAVAAFVAPPFTGLDTLPSLGVVVLSLGVLLDDGLVAVAGVVIGAAGIVAELFLGSLALKGIKSLF